MGTQRLMELDLEALTHPYKDRQTDRQTEQKYTHFQAHTFTLIALKLLELNKFGKQRQTEQKHT